MSKKERSEFVQRTILVLASGVSLNILEQIRAATVTLAREHNVALPADFPRE